jgi:hypothetical protein
VQPASKGHAARQLRQGAAGGGECWVVGGWVGERLG